MRRLVVLALCVYAFSIPLETIVIAGVGTPQRLLAITTAILWMLMILVERQGRLRIPRWWMWLGLFGVWAVTSISWAKDVPFTVSHVVSILQLISFTLVLADMAEGERAGTLLASYSAGAISAAALALLTGQTIGFANRLELEGAGPAHLAAALWPAIVYLSYRVFQPSRPIRRALAIVAVGLLLITVLMTSTRSAWVALVVAALVLAVREPRARWGAIIVGTAVVGAIFMVPELYHRAIVEPVRSGGAGRIDIWKVGLLIAAEHPLWGVGFANFFQNFTWDVISRAGSFIYPTVVVPGRDAHNIFLQITAELGLIGLVLFAIPLLAATIVGLQKRATTLHRLIVALLLGYLAEGFFLPILNRKYFWLVIGLSIATLKWRYTERSAAAGSSASAGALTKP